MKLKSDKHRPADGRRRDRSGSAWSQDLDRDKADAGPDQNAEQRHAEHREQLAQKHRFHRDRGRQNFDNLVGFFFDQIGQHHAGQQHRQEEDKYLPALCGDGAQLFIVIGGFYDDIVLRLPVALSAPGFTGMTGQKFDIGLLAVNRPLRYR